MPRPIDRDRRRKRRARARKAAARMFARPIYAALEQRADVRHQFVLDRLHDKSRDGVLIPSARQSPQPAAPAVSQSAPPAARATLAAVDGPLIADGAVAAEPARAVTVDDAVNGTPQKRAGFLAMLRKVRESLWLPVLLAIVVIGLSNRLSSRAPLGTHLAPALAVGSSVQPPETPQALSVSGLPAEAVAPASAAASLATVPPVETIAALSTQPGQASDSATITARETDFLPRTRACAMSEIATFKASAAPVEANAFGVALALAAEAQTGDFVVYNDEYFNLRYPGGDVPALYGVCSDVVIRAYRALGVDLQRLVHEARVGSGDTSIDHRRTETLRRFFARHGTQLPVTDFAEDYRPGDIVSYERPQNRGAQVHIAVVSSQNGPSGHPMIVHNRGWGPQIEDALFVDHITGHYRMTGQPKLLTSWGINKSHGPGLNSWSTLVRRAAIVRGSGRGPKAKSNPKL